MLDKNELGDKLLILEIGFCLEEFNEFQVMRMKLMNNYTFCCNGHILVIFNNKKM